jgi:hypothetical protein
MQTTTHVPAGHVLRNPLVVGDVCTQSQNNTATRSIAFRVGALLAPAAVGAGLVAFRGSRRAGLLGAGATALAFGLVRWQLARWFYEEPAYELEQRIGRVEIRLYAPRVEAHTKLATSDFDDARERGFRRLAAYIFGSNFDGRVLEMTTPVTVAPRSSAHTVAFVMPPGQHHSELPHPADARVDLVDVPARRVAVLRYHGGWRARTIAHQADRLRALVADAGLTAIGTPMFAAYDPPSTLPLLRRSEVWIELA